MDVKYLKIAGYLEHTTKAIMDKLVDGSSGGGEVQVLSVITKPLVDRIVQIDKEVLECWSKGDNCTDADDLKLIKQYCSDKKKKSAAGSLMASLNYVIQDDLSDIYDSTTEEYNLTTLASTDKKPCKIFTDINFTELLQL